MQNIPWLYSVEQGRNMNRNDAYDLWFHFQFLNMNFSGVKAHQNFVLIFKKLENEMNGIINHSFNGLT